MNQQWKKTEQGHLNDIIGQIELIVSDLESRVRKPEDRVDYQIQQTLMKRINGYRDAIPSPYFGKLEIVFAGEQSSETYLLGETAVAKSEVEELVIDWRNPLNDVYYSFNGGTGEASYESETGERYHVTVRRKRNLNIKNKEILNISEVRSDAYSPPPGEDSDDSGMPVDDFFERFGSDRSKDYQLRKIVATIQKEQNEAIRLGIQEPVLIQGVAGSGKTSIALHRLSYLLYQYRKQLKPENIMILAPNRLFISYMKNILPGLELDNVQQNTFIDLAKRWLPQIDYIQTPQEWLSEAIVQSDLSGENNTHRYKGSMKFKKLIERYLDHIEENFFRPKELRLSTFTSEKIEPNEQFLQIYNGYKHLPLNQRRTETIRSIKSWVELELQKQDKILEGLLITASSEWVFHIPETEELHARVKKALKESSEFRSKKLRDEWFSQVESIFKEWKTIEPIELYMDLMDDALLQGFDHSLSNELAADIASSGPNRDNLRRIGYDDIAALLLLHMRVYGLDEKYDYLMIDEAQDLSAFQISILMKLTKSMTVLGDITQSVYGDLGMQNWDELKMEVFEGRGRSLDLTISYRSTFEIMSTANSVINASNLRLPCINPINRHGTVPTLKKVNNGGELISQIRITLDQLIDNKGYHKIAIISKDPKLSKALFNQFETQGMNNIQLVEDPNDLLKEPIIFIAASLVKGLEFDAVIIPNANLKTFTATPLDTKLLFISMTRPQEELHIFYYGEPSPLLEPLIRDSKSDQQDILEGLL
ncbi:HelD family protein [Paenibacillus planticolens]|uniref:AAA family ATPase n=1 Tax=Paenibacillus planticolens TaxID=2654976 RepID=A0ABX1ZHH2_9BACL|nr:UvrD-helicase domain-containing protein [Paenibacillus planticolens]NOU99529.1 AAA family ATPase [Paenibacillus planticolens]